MRGLIFGTISIILLAACTKNISTLPDITATVSRGDYVMNDSTLLKCGFIKTFEDNFDNGLLQWNIWTGGACNNELQYYRAANLHPENGILAIRAIRENITGNRLPDDPSLKNFTYSSGRIESKYTITINPDTPKIRIAARMKLPAGYGMWPAFWSYGHPWPTQGEIDFLEARGNEPDRYYTNYFFGTADQLFTDPVSATIITGIDLTAAYHVYEVEWTENYIRSFIDGKSVENKTCGTHLKNLFGTRQQMVLNLAVGGNFFADADSSLIKPGTLYIDWVKVFTNTSK